MGPFCAAEDESQVSYWHDECSKKQSLQSGAYKPAVSGGSVGSRLPSASLSRTLLACLRDYQHHPCRQSYASILRFCLKVPCNQSILPCQEEAYRGSAGLHLSCRHCGDSRCIPQRGSASLLDKSAADQNSSCQHLTHQHGAKN